MPIVALLTVWATVLNTSCLLPTEIPLHPLYTVGPFHRSSATAYPELVCRWTELLLVLKLSNELSCSYWQSSGSLQAEPTSALLLQCRFVRGLLEVLLDLRELTTP